MDRIAYSIVFVSDMQKSVRFYRDVLGLPLKFESPEWTEFATEGTTLALHRGDPAGTPPPNRPTAGLCHLGFQVDDLDEIHTRFTSQGVRCIQPPKKQDFGGRLATYADPDGLPLTFSDYSGK